MRDCPSIASFCSITSPIIEKSPVKEIMAAAAIVLDKLPHTIHSLPYGVISTARNPKPRCAVAIGDHAIDLCEYSRSGRLSQVEHEGDAFEDLFAQVRGTPNRT
jgi:hypothetical protein